MLGSPSGKGKRHRHANTPGPHTRGLGPASVTFKGRSSAGDSLLCNTVSTVFVMASKIWRPRFHKTCVRGGKGRHEGDAFQAPPLSVSWTSRRTAPVGPPVGVTTPHAT